MIYFKKDKIELKKSDIKIQLDLSEIKDGNYLLQEYDNFISILKGEKEIAIIVPYNNYRENATKNSIFISNIDFEILKKKLTLYIEKKKITVIS